MEKKNSQTTVRLPDQLLDSLKMLAEADDRSLASYIAIVLQAHVDQLDEADFLDPERLAEAVRKRRQVFYGTGSGAGEPPPFDSDSRPKIPAPPSKVTRVQRSIVKRSALKK